jgi:hypothetical protein
MLEDWLKHQDAADTPESSVRSDDGKVEPVQSVELEFQDDVNMEGQDGDGDDVWESVSQRDENETDDSPFMQMDELTRWMGHYGWKFKLVTPEAMDVEMSKMAEQALGRSLAPNVSVVRFSSLVGCMREEERLTDNLTPDRTRPRDELQRMETTSLLTTPWTMCFFFERFNCSPFERGHYNNTATKRFPSLVFA